MLKRCSSGSPSSGLTGVTALAAAVAIGVAVSGCGASAKPTISKARFVAKANAICSKANNTLGVVEGHFSNKTTAAEFEAFIKGTLIPNIQGQIDAVRALGAPSGEQATVTNMLNLAQTDLNHVKSNPTLEISTNAKPFAKFAKVAHTYGLTDCASNE